MSSKFDEFYPELVGFNTQPFKQLGMVLKLTAHLETARAGNRDAESRLCNRIGQIRRACPSGVDSLPPDLVAAVKESVDWLRSTGRVLRLANPDPRDWISRRDGKPRW